MLDDVATLVGVRAAEKGLELVISRPPEVPVLLLGDPLRVGQILTNLASNAVKFTEKGEVHISVSLRATHGDRVELRFQVEDTGIGLTTDQQSKLFRPFAQADGSTTRRFGGTGLGLAICARLVKLMDGTIGVESEAGHGSRFFFTVVLSRAHRRAATAARRAACGSRQARSWWAKPMRLRVARWWTHWWTLGCRSPA
jgi:signal transduction histidine kinase